MRDIYNGRQQNSRVLVALSESRRYMQGHIHQGRQAQYMCMSRARSCGPQDATGMKFKGRGCSRENGRYARGRSSGGGQVMGGLSSVSSAPTN